MLQQIQDELNASQSVVEHVFPRSLTEQASKLERATEWLATTGMALAAIGMTLAALATMGAR